LFFSCSLVYADDFHLTEDYADSEVFVTTLFSIEELSASEHEIYTVEYDLDEVVGNRTDFLQDNVFWNDHIRFVDGRYRRFFVSRINKVMGNLGVFGVEATYDHNFYNFFGHKFQKYGDYIYSPLIVNVQENETKLVHLASFDIFQPLKVEYFNWEPNILENGDLLVNFELKLKSLASFQIRNIEFSHGDYYHKRDFRLDDENVYEYAINYGNDYGPGLNLLDSFEIKKAGPKTECLVYGSTDFINPSPDTKTLVYERTDVDGSEDWFGKTVDVDWYPKNEAMCVTLMPYSLVGKKLEYNVPLDIEAHFLNEKGVLGIGDELILEVEVLKGDVELNFDSDFQKLKNSDCDITLVEQAILLKEGSFCKIVFEILDHENFLILKNSLSFEEEVFDTVTFKYIPDIEFSFEYDYDLKEFVFESSVEDISNFSVLRDDFLCRKISFLGLEDEVCI
jgi:hypothetical protein